jgi:hypothetical protein
MVLDESFLKFHKKLYTFAHSFVITTILASVMFGDGYLFCL